jgi:transcriptional regulator with XRE-family HTH domain
MDATEHTPSTVAARELRAAMARQNRKGKDLARLLGCSKQSAYRRMNGETPLNLNELELLARWLKVTVTTLLPADEQVRK